MRLFLIPAADRRVLDPHTHRPLPAGGEWVDVSDGGAQGTYWRRRLVEGDVQDGTPASGMTNAATTATNARPGRARARHS